MGVGGGALSIYTGGGVPRHKGKGGGGPRHGHNPKKGAGLWYGHNPKKRGLSYGHESKKGGVRHVHKLKGGGGVLRTAWSCKKDNLSNCMMSHKRGFWKLILILITLTFLLST